MITSVAYWPAKSTHQFERSNRAGFRQYRPTAALLSKNPSNLSVWDTPLPESVDYSLILPISGGPALLGGHTELAFPWQERTSASVGSINVCRSRPTARNAGTGA
ncbi:hypothetical protein OUZ56_020563 [Daphnia magna]|uniref:Uncharacterized protein n=1 Tax=Daphnia magna TaxID=35525 RepID=A0ABQ9ZET8_9CRUS|nr:hypothetical protein OUZ56_020563 [Daphnia magna]